MKGSFALLLCLIPFLAAGQESPSPTPVPLKVPEVETTAPGTIRVRFYIPPARGILMEESMLPSFPPNVWVQTASGPAKLELRRNGYTRSVDLNVLEEVSLFRLTPEGEKGELYVKTALPQESDRGVALINPDEVGEDGNIPFTVYPLSAAHSPAGWHSFLNALEREVEIRINDQSHHVAMGEQIALKLDDGRQRIYLMESGGKQSRRYTGAIYPQKNRGVLHVIKAQPNSTRRIQLLTLVGPHAAVEEPAEP